VGCGGSGERPVWKRAGAVQAVVRRALGVRGGVDDRSVVWWLGRELWVAESGVAWWAG